MLEAAALRRATIVGTMLQLALAILAHFSGWVALHGLLFLGMMIAAISGYLYAQEVGKGYFAGAGGGLVSGAVCGVFGLALSIVLGDTDPALLLQNLAIFAFIGAVGGLFGQMAANVKPARH